VTRSRPSRGFTLIELLLAMVIGTLVVAGGYALVAMASRMDGRYADRLETSNKLAFVQRTVARSLQSIVAAPDEYDPVQAARAAIETAERIEVSRRDGDDGEDEAGGARTEARLAEIRSALDEPREVDPAPARLRIGHTDRRGEWTTRSPDRAALGDRRLEMLLARPPFGDRSRGEPIRGALELIYTPRAEEDRWRLQWRPLRPAGAPTVLLEDLTLAEWSVTDSQGQFDEFTAYSQPELPWAVRLILWTEGGVRVDWMFDLGAASTTGDPI